MAWKMPFEDLETDDVEKRYAAEEFPDVTRLLAGDIIRDCWAEKFDTSRDVEEAIRKLQQKLKSDLSEDTSFYIVLPASKRQHS
jgi:hypothetical protein